MRIAERVARKGMNIPRSADPYEHMAFRRYMESVRRREDRAERALRKIIEMLPRTDKEIVLVAPGRSGRRLVWWIKEGLKEYNPNNVRLHRINAITLPISARNAIVSDGKRILKIPPATLAKMVVQNGNVRIYRDLARAVKSGRALPVFIDAVKVTGRTEQLYREFFKHFGIDMDSVPKIILAGDDTKDDDLWDFAANLIESPYAFPVAIDKKRVERSDGSRSVAFSKYVRRRDR